MRNAWTSSEGLGVTWGNISTVNAGPVVIAAGVVRYDGQYYSVRSLGATAGFSLPVGLTVDYATAYDTIDDVAGFSAEFSASLGFGANINLLNGGVTASGGIQAGFSLNGMYTWVRPIDFDPRQTVPAAYGSGRTPLGEDGTIRIGDEYNSLDEIAEAIEFSAVRSGFENSETPIEFSNVAAESAFRNVTGNEFCFLAGTMIDMWPIDLSIKSDNGGFYDEAAVRARVWQKPIEEVSPDDWVLSFDEKNNLKPGKVVRTFTNKAKIVLDFFGTGVTPGHAYYRADSKNADKFATLIDILRDDGVVQRANGTQIRAAINCEVGSPNDREFWAVIVSTDETGTERVRDKKKIRLGTRFMLPDGRHFSMRDFMEANDIELLENGYVRFGENGVETPFIWPFSDRLPNPEDFVLARSRTTLMDIYRADEWEDRRPSLPAPI